MKKSKRGNVDPFIVMDVMENARKAEERGKDIVHMEVGQPGTPAPIDAQKELIKIMKNDMNVFFDADPDLQKIRAQIEYLTEVVDFIKRCMDNITWRHQTIKNTIEWRKFMAGQ